MSARVAALFLIAAAIACSSRAPSDAELLVLRDRVPGECAFLRMDPIAKRTTEIAVLDTACENVRFASAPDSSQLLLAMPVGTAGNGAAALLGDSGISGPHEYWTVSVTGATALGEPPASAMPSFGYSTAGAPVVTGMILPSARAGAAWDKLRSTLESGDATCAPGKALAFSAAPGWPVIAETEVPCPSGSRGSRFSPPPTAPIGPALRSPPAGTRTFERDGRAVREHAELEALMRFDAEDARKWRALDDEPGAAYARPIGIGNLGVDVPVVLRGKNGLSPIEGMGTAGPIKAMLASARGRFLLASEVDGTSARLYDLRSGEQIWRDDAIAVFWPHAVPGE